MFFGVQRASVNLLASTLTTPRMHHRSNPLPRRGALQISLRWLLVLVVVMALGAFGLRTYREQWLQNREVTFADPMVQAAVEMQLATRPVRQRMLARIQSLSIGPTTPGSRPETQLADIGRLKNLERLSLFDITVSDSGPLAELPQLHHLEMIDCTVKDLSGLAQCEKLEILRLPKGEYSLPSLKRAKQLFDVRIDGFRPDHWRSLFNNQDVRILKLEGDLGGDLTAIGRMPRLSTLELTQTSRGGSLGPPKDLTQLRQLDNLVRLSLVGFAQDDDTPPDLRPLETLPSLERLRLADCNVENLTALRDLVKLRELSLSSNQIQDLSPLQGLVELETLHLDSNRISELSALAGLGKLKWLSFGFNQVEDISPLENLTALETLLLNDNRIDDISPLEPLPNLSHDMRRPRSGWDILVRLPTGGMRTRNAAGNVGAVDLSNNRIRDLTPLTRNPGLALPGLALPFGDPGPVNLSGNPLDLDDPETAAAIKQLRKREIEVVVDD